jgi:hypothetical protein
MATVKVKAHNRAETNWTDDEIIRMLNLLLRYKRKGATFREACEKAAEESLVRRSPLSIEMCIRRMLCSLWWAGRIQILEPSRPLDHPERREPRNCVSCTHNWKGA